MDDFTIKPFGADTWDDFAALIERQGTGSMGAPACWCLWFHPGQGRDKACRKRGVAAAALRGALDLIAKAGGGTVEGYPHDVPAGKKMSSTFLYNLTRSAYEAAGFEYERPKGKGNCVMKATVPPSP